MLLLCIRMLLLCFLTSTSFSGSSPTRSVSRSARTGRVEHPGNEVVLMLLHVTHMYSPCTRMYPCVTCTYPCGALVEIATWPAVSLWKVRTQKSFRLSLIIRVIGLLFLLTVIDVSTTCAVVIFRVRDQFCSTYFFQKYKTQGAAQSALNSAPVPHTHPKKFQFGI